MVANYIKPAIGAAAYGAMARNCGILAFTPTTWAASTQKTDFGHFSFERHDGMSCQQCH